MAEKQLLAPRFWRKVNVGKYYDCWEWEGSRFRLGYGSIRVNDKIESTHRIAWLLTNGEIKKGLHVLHKCDNRACCNPAHLYLGTHKDNMADMYSKGRRAPATRIPEETITAIRKMGKHEKPGFIAKHFGISSSHASRIIRGKSRIL